jgi:hypothetical protein
MLLDTLRSRMTAAMKAHNTVEKELLRTALGEITMTMNVEGVPGSDDLVIKVLKKLQKSNQETLKLATDADQRSQLETELSILGELLPKELSVDLVLEMLAPVRDAIRAARAEGPAIGIAMKHLKASAIDAEGKTVAEAIAKLRS